MRDKLTFIKIMNKIPCLEFAIFALTCGQQLCLHSMKPQKIILFNKLKDPEKQLVGKIP